MVQNPLIHGMDNIFMHIFMKEKINECVDDCKR
jgi:hypothetical protein